MEHPELPLHNNPAELAARTIVQRRNISYATQTCEGTKAMDVFMSLVATTRKLGISFFEYMHDRISYLGNIPSLGTIIRQQSSVYSLGVSWSDCRNFKKYKGSELLVLDSCSKCRINPRLIVTLVAKKDYDILDFMINNMSYSTMLCLDC
ncbi:hypothetical protein QUA81_23380 [Microcoleus sp. F6_B4]